jgi:hypothetical protein
MYFCAYVFTSQCHNWNGSVGTAAEVHACGTRQDVLLSRRTACIAETVWTRGALFACNWSFVCLVQCRWLGYGCTQIVTLGITFHNQAVTLCKSKRIWFSIFLWCNLYCRNTKHENDIGFFYCCMQQRWTNVCIAKGWSEYGAMLEMARSVTSHQISWH